MGFAPTVGVIVCLIVAVVGKSNVEEVCNQYAETYYPDISEDGTSTPKDGCTGFNDKLDSPSSKDAPPKKYPHMAMLGHFRENSSMLLICEGSLVSDRFLLSAASCNFLGVIPKMIRLGEYNQVSDEDEKNGLSQHMTYDIIDVVVHPEYKPPSRYNNIALYKVNTTVVFNKYIKPLCIQKERLVDNNELVVAGWGREEFMGRSNSILQEMGVKILPLAVCREQYTSQVDELQDGIRDESMMCVGNIQTGYDTCSVFAGGPLLKRMHPNCMYSLVGISSFGVRCGAPHAGVYSRVSHFVPWIECIIWP